MPRIGTSGIKNNMRAGNDISLKVSGDPGFNSSEMELQTEVEVLKQQIAMILYTRKHDVLGSKMLGANLEDLIYSLRSTEGLIESTVMQQIQTFCPAANRYTVQARVNFFKGTTRDIAILDITIDNTTKFGLILK
tara:strand:- start:19852 stop:20256 length:405 start_codon:yes stop_codon:yes gene_type:complete